MIQSQSSNLVDPFQGLSILSLNPRTFRDDSLKSNDLEAIHQHMTALALQNPEKHFKEAKSILDGGLELLDIKENEVNLKENKNPRENRPALARKRAKFSLKPDLREPSTIPEPSFQFDQSLGPDEFFAAYEKYENTVKELKRLKGEDVNEAKIPTTKRQRRPELPRRKVSYQHHVYSSQPENDSSFSQEILQDNIGSPPTQYSQEPVNPDFQSKEDEVAGSVTKTQDRVNELFDELMSSDIDKLDENGALSFLKDRLKIKPVDVNSLKLPDFHEISKVDLVSSINSLINDQSILSDTHGLPDGLRVKTPLKQKKLSDSPFLPLASPTPPKSPFLAISTFGKHISKSIQSSDPFSTHSIVLFPPATSESIDEQSTHVSKDKEFLNSGSLDSLKKNKVTETLDHDVSQKISAEVIIISPECHNREERDADDNKAGSYVVTDSQTNQNIQGNAEDTMQKAASATELNINVEDYTENVNVDPHCIQDVEENVEDVTRKAGSSTSPKLNVEVSTVAEDLNIYCSPSAQSETDDNSMKELNVSRPDENPDSVPEQQNEENPRKSVEKRIKTKRAQKVDPKKRRQSLAAAGTFWNSGVRRSNRIRRKPLEYWKGERLLYGRIHNSLPTVIGVKYLSSTNGEHGFKVESFVSDKYKDLVELAALH